jgi:hypothetical protein
MLSKTESITKPILPTIVKRNEPCVHALLMKACTHGSFLFTIVGSIGLVMLSVLDNIAHHFMHDA